MKKFVLASVCTFLVAFPAIGQEKKAEPIAPPSGVLKAAASQTEVLVFANRHHHRRFDRQMRRHGSATVRVDACGFARVGLFHRAAACAVSVVSCGK